jgi:hypothetical protein
MTKFKIEFDGYTSHILERIGLKQGTSLYNFVTTDKIRDRKHYLHVEKQLYSLIAQTYCGWTYTQLSYIADRLKIHSKPRRKEKRSNA